MILEVADIRIQPGQRGHLAQARDCGISGRAYVVDHSSLQ